MVTIFKTFQKTKIGGGGGGGKEGGKIQYNSKWCLLMRTNMTGIEQQSICFAATEMFLIFLYH